VTATADRETPFAAADTGTRTSSWGALHAD